jgi:hypothetical protein
MLLLLFVRLLRLTLSCFLLAILQRLRLSGPSLYRLQLLVVD